MHHATSSSLAFRAVALLLVVLLSGCWQAREPDLSGTWENAEVGSLRLTQTDNVLVAEQKDPVFANFFGPNMFEGRIQDGLITGRVATALPVNLKAFCGQNWGSWAQLELRIAPDGLSLVGRWLRTHSRTSEPGCPTISTEWVDVSLVRGPGEVPVDLTPWPIWLAALVLLFGAGLGFAMRQAWVNYLVGPQKRSPNQAANSGWLLFASFVLASALAATPLLGPAFAAPLVWIALLLLSLLCLALALLLGLRR